MRCLRRSRSQPRSGGGGPVIILVALAAFTLGFVMGGIIVGVGFVVDQQSKEAKGSHR